jgi:hypothetical protein
MPKKSTPQKAKSPKQPLTIRASDEDRENISSLRSMLADDVHPELNTTQVISTALKVAKKALTLDRQA